MFQIDALTGAKLSGPRSILRVVQVFTQLSAQPQGQTLAQLCKSLGLPKTTLFTMLKVLEKAHYLGHEAGIYRLGPQAVALGAAMADTARRNFPDCAKGSLESLCLRTGETVFLAVLTPDRQFCKYVSVVETDNWLRFTVKLGSQRPSYATGSGRAMLAYLPDEELRLLLEQFRFERVTPKTVSTRSRLLASLRQVRKRAVSVVDSGTVTGVVSVAAPIFDADGRVQAAVTVGGPTMRLTDRLPTIEQAVRDSAGDISRILGFAGDWPARPGARAGLATD
jgi:IclR family acetate operon transcriptional repressor